MRLELYLNDFVRASVLEIDHDLQDRQLLIKKKLMKLMIFFELI